MENIVENNRLIAEFMGVKIGVDSYSWRIGCIETLKETHLNYHSEWGWLMPVVLKIENLGYRVVIIDCGCHINDNNGEYDNTIYDRRSKIEAVYQSVIEFIKWYNQNK